MFMDGEGMSEADASIPVKDVLKYVKATNRYPSQLVFKAYSKQQKIMFDKNIGRYMPNVVSVVEEV